MTDRAENQKELSKPEPSDKKEGRFFGVFSDDLFFSEDDDADDFIIESSDDDFEKSPEEITTTRGEPVSKTESFEIVSEEGSFEDKIFIDDASFGDDEDEDAPEISWEQEDGGMTAAAAIPSKIGEYIMSLAENQPSEGKPQTIPCSFVFTNPITLAMVSGLARNFDGETLEFKPDIESFILNLDKGTRIDSATLKANDKIEPVRATVIFNDEEKLVLKITKR